MQDSTKKMYNMQLKKYSYLDITNPEQTFDNLQAVRKKDDKCLSNQYIKSILCSIIYKIKEKDPKSPLLRSYRYMVGHLRSQQEKKDRNNNFYGGYIPSWKNIIEKRENLKNTNDRDYLLLSLYTYVAPRRLKDFMYMKFVNTPNEADDNNFNYYIASKKIFIFNVYKTQKTYKQQIIKVPHELHKIIIKFVKDNSINDNDFLLPIRSQQLMTYHLKKLVGSSIDGIRHSYINNEYKKFNMPSSKFIEDLSHNMGHSVETNLRYRKFI